jgi:hypothetical protein
MKTRKDYLSGKVTHREYYAQFVNDDIKRNVRFLGINAIKKAYEIDPLLNTISLAAWDSCGRCPRSVAERMREAGDYPTMAGMVCLHKEAAKQLIGA